MSAIASIADVSRVYPTTQPAPVGPSPVAPTPTGVAPVDFGDVLHDAVGRVVAMEDRAAHQVEGLASGATDDIHGTMISVQEASIGVRLLGSVRNKLLDAFHEVWRTGV